MLLRQLLFALIVLTSSTMTTVAQDQQTQLKQIEKEIKRQKNQLSKHQSKQSSLQKSLQKDELAIAKLVGAQRVQQQQLQQAQASLNQLTKQQKQLAKQELQQKEQLRNQLIAMYMSGPSDHTATLLGSLDSAQIDRMMIYYQSVNQARFDSLIQLKETQSELIHIVSQQQTQLQKEQYLKQQLEQQAQKLKQSQNKRQQSLQAVQQDLSQNRNRLTALAEDQNILQTLIKQAQEALKQKQRATAGLSKLKGQLPWPVQGKITHQFGEHRQGQLNWNGWMLTAPSGQNVSAIGSGQVVFADWLRGFGLVIVIEHGDQYLSLYGHAQTLLKQVGDYVQQGEVISLTGNSGGLSQAGLYFEIRHKGQAVNPKGYLLKG